MNIMNQLLLILGSLILVVVSGEKYCSLPDTASIEGGTQPRTVLFESHVELTCCLPDTSVELAWFSPDSHRIPNYFTHPNVGAVYVMPDLMALYEKKQVLHLVIKNFNSTNSGIYTCRVLDNSNNFKSGRVALTGRERIKIESPKEQFLLAGVRGEIACTVRNVDKVDIAWFRHGVHIQPKSGSTSGPGESKDGKYAFSQAGQRLVIPMVTPDYADHYLCKAEVVSDQADRTAFIEMQPIDMEVYSPPVIPPGSPRMVSKSAVLEGGTLEIACEARGAPAVDVLWYKGWGESARQIHWDAVKIAVSTTYGRHYVHSTLRVNSVERQDAGNYTCRAVVAIPRANISEMTNRTIAPNMVFKPVILPETVVSGVGDVGDTISLRCRVFGGLSSTMRAELFQYDVPCQRSERHRFYDNSDPVNLIADVTMTIEGLTESDGGAYSCRGESLLGKASLSGSLKVWYAPRVTATTPTVYGLKHFQNVLSCEAKAMPNPTWTWTLDNRQVISDSFKYYISTRYQEDKSTSDLLVLPSYWNTGLYGKYECKATNRLGDASDVVNFQQAWRPDKPTVTACAIRQRTIQLCVTPPNNTGGLPLSHYQIRLQPKSGERFFGPFAHPLTPTIDISSLVPATNYRIAVSAVSPAGRSSNTIIVAHTLPLSAPTIELNVSPDNAETDAYNIRWTVKDKGGFNIDHVRIRIREVSVDSNNQIERALSPWKQHWAPTPGERNYFRVNSLKPDSFYEVEVSVGTVLQRSAVQKMLIRTRGPRGIAMGVFSPLSGSSVRPCLFATIIMSIISLNF